MKEVQMFIFIFFSLLYNVYGQNPTNDSNWQLHWFDEYNDNSVDDTKWNYKRYGQTCWGDYCLTNYDANRREVNNSKLELICRKENCSCYEVTDWSPYTVQYHNKSYTSGEVTSKETFKYGYFKIRSRIPDLRNDPNYTGKGFGPNFWLFPLNGYTNPDVDYSEIDIYEIKGYDYQFTCNVRFSRSNGT